MAFYINGVLVDAVSLTTAIDFKDTIVPYGQGMNSNTSFTDNQVWLRCPKVIAYLASGTRSTTGTAIDKCGLTRRAFLLGSHSSVANSHRYCDLRSDYTGGGPPYYQYLSNPYYYSRCVYDSYMVGCANLIKFCNYGGDSSLKYVYIGD
jgi:hypothetical protein